MKVWVADELGQIKSCSVDNSPVEGELLQSETSLLESSSQGHGRSDYVQIMAHVKWETAGKSMSAVAVARRGGSLQILDAKTGQVKWERLDARVDADDMFVALEESNGNLFWCTNLGYFGFVRLAGEPDLETTAPVDFSEQITLEGLEDLKLKGPVSKARCHPRFPGLFAFGGKEVDLEIWRTPTESSLGEFISFTRFWNAKNVRNDEYNLKQPVWISDLRFLDEERRSLTEGFRIATCTRFHQIRIYDTQLSRRPIVNVDAGPSPLVSLALGANDTYHQRHVTSFSVEKGVANGNFAGPTGSVLALDVHKDPGERSVLACVGLDRFLRLYDLGTRAAIGKVYCKTKMTSVLVIEGSMAPPNPSSPSAKRKKLSEVYKHRAEDDESDSEVWAMLPEVSNVGSSGVKRRRVRV